MATFTWEDEEDAPVSSDNIPVGTQDEESGLVDSVQQSIDEANEEDN